MEIQKGFFCLLFVECKEVHDDIKNKDKNIGYIYRLLERISREYTLWLMVLGIRYFLLVVFSHLCH